MKPFRPKPALRNMKHKAQPRTSRGGRWHKASVAYRKAHPICEYCNKRAAVEVDHVKPWHEYPKLRYDTSNLKSTCHDCHKDRHYGTQ